MRFLRLLARGLPVRCAQDGNEVRISSYNRAGLVHTKEVFFDPNVKSDAPRDNANFLYKMGKGEILDSPEEISKIMGLDGTYSEKSDAHS